MGELRASFDEKRNIFRFQDRAKNPHAGLSSARSEKDRREAGQSTMIRSEARPGETRPDEDQPRRRRLAFNCPKRHPFSLCYLVTVVSRSTDSYDEVFPTRAAPRRVISYIRADLRIGDALNLLKFSFSRYRTFHALLVLFCW